MPSRALPVGHVHRVLEVYERLEGDDDEDCCESRREEVRVLLVGTADVRAHRGRGPQRRGGGEAEDGGPLHDQFCLGCHVSMFGGDGSTIYLRTERRVNSIEGLMGQVAFCNEQIKVGLNEYEIDDIVAYLNESYYRFETD